MLGELSTYENIERVSECLLQSHSPAAPAEENLLRCLLPLYRPGVVAMCNTAVKRGLIGKDQLVFSIPS